MTPITLWRIQKLMFPLRERLFQLFVLAFFLILTRSTCAQQASAGSAQPQSSASNALTDGRDSWDLGVFLGGGTGAGKSSNTQFLYAGGRGGLILSPDLFTSTPIRGNFEYAIEIMPVYTVFTPVGAVYGASIKPIILQWNFTKPRTVLPYVHIGGGVRWFVRPARSLDFQVDVVHHSNASLGDHNPGYNASVFFSVGYSWYQHRR